MVFISSHGSKDQGQRSGPGPEMQWGLLQASPLVPLALLTW